MVVFCSVALLSLAGTGLALIGGGQVSSAPVVPARFPPTSSPKPVGQVVVVRTVSAIDSFEGVDTAGGDVVRVRIADVRSPVSCWQAESLGFARDALLDKEVRLVSAGGRAPDGRLPARVQLPGGEDFAFVALSAGAAMAGAEVGPELLAAESGARANRLGLWANACAPGQEQIPSSVGETPTTTASPTRQPDETTAPTSVTTEPATTTEPPDPDIQQGAQVGKPCSPEGALGVSRNGRDVKCRRTVVGLRWVVR